MSGAARTWCVLARVTPSAGEVSQKFTLLTLSKFERARERERERARARERERERGREAERQREIDRQRDRETDRDRQRQTETESRQTDRQTERERERERDVHMLRGSLEIAWRSDGRYETPNLPSLSFFSCGDPM